MMAGKKIKRTVLITSGIIVLLVGMWFGSIFTGWPPGASTYLNPFRPKISTTSEAVLTEVRDLLQVRTVEYIYRTVFPYDFVPSDMDWNALLDRKARGTRLTPAEMVLLDRYEFCRSVGIDLSSSKKTFVVITTIIHGGYNLASQDNGAGLVQVDGDELIIRLPDPEILEVIVEDSRSEDYGYPDISMSPESWKKVTDFVDAHVRQEVLDDGILQTARTNGEEVLRRIFVDAGWKAVSFY